MPESPYFLSNRPEGEISPLVPWHDCSMPEMTSVSRDRVARILQGLRMSGTFYCSATLGSPWGLEMPAIADSVSFHFLVEGTCWLHVPGEDPVRLEPGDVALVPHGLGHHLADGITVDQAPRVDHLPQSYLGPSYSVLRHGGEGVQTRLVCGVVSFNDPTSRELMNALPPIVVTRAHDSAATRDTLNLMVAELLEPRVGGEAVVTRLADVIVLHTVRAWITDGEHLPMGWLAGLSDDRIGRALEAIHTDPGAPWTVSTLARVATMSRTAFCERFTNLVGIPPIAHLTAWRMRMAEGRLASEDVTVGEVARELGYRSESAFSRAFRNHIGHSPGGGKVRAPSVATQP